MNKKFLFSSVITSLILIFFIWFVFAAAPDSLTSPNYPSNNQLLPSDTTSIILNITVTDADSATLNVTFYNASDNTLLCTNTSVSNNSVALCNWTGLSDGAYQWYVNVTDGTDTTQSTTWDFSVLSSSCSSNISSDYTMTSSLYCNDTAIYINNSNVTFDCDDNSIFFVGSDNTGYYAFNVSFVDNITLQNCNIEGFGIFIDNATNLDILDNEITNVSAVNTNAISIEDGENITIKRNLFNATDTAMDESVHLYKHWKAIEVNNDDPPAINSTRNLVIYNNTIIDHEWAMNLGGITDLNVSRNKINVTQLYRTMTISLSYTRDAVFDRNVQYRTIDDEWHIDSDGYVVDAGCRNITISNGNITNIQVHGIIMLDYSDTGYYPQNITIKNMRIRNCIYSLCRGISFWGETSDKAVYTENSSVIGNNISLCGYGIEVGKPNGGASNSKFINNTVYDINENAHIGALRCGFCDVNWNHDRANNLFKNNVVYNIAGTASFNMAGSTNYSFINNTIYGTAYRGMWFQGILHNNTFINNTIYNAQYSGTSAIEYGDNATFINNLIYDADGYGISVNSNCNLTENTIRNTTRGISVGGDNNNISSNTFEGNNYSIYLSDADNNYFYDIDASDSVVADIYATSSSSTTNYFINVSHNKSDVSVLNSANISFRWYLDAHATNGRVNLSNVTITGLDKNDNQRFSDTTGSFGNITRQTVEEYYQTSSGRTYFTSYIINASKPGYITEETTQNITDSRLLEFILSGESSTRNKGGSGGRITGSSTSNNESLDGQVPKTEQPPEEEEEKNKEGNFLWVIVLLILVIVIIVTKKIKGKKKNKLNI